MIAWHVTSKRKLDKYLRSGQINSPVRAWLSIEDAMRFSISTGRRIILRIKVKQYDKLGGHKNKAIISQQPIAIKGY